PHLQAQTQWPTATKGLSVFAPFTSIPTKYCSSMASTWKSRHVQSSGPRWRRLGSSRSRAIFSHRTTERNGRERLSHFAQSAHARASRRLRPPWHARDGRNAHDVLGQGRLERTGTHDTPRPQSPVYFSLVTGQR